MISVPITVSKELSISQLDSQNTNMIVLRYFVLYLSSVFLLKHNRVTLPETCLRESRLWSTEVKYSKIEKQQENGMYGVWAWQFGMSGTSFPAVVGFDCMKLLPRPQFSRQVYCVLPFRLMARIVAPMMSTFLEMTLTLSNYWFLLCFGSILSGLSAFNLPVQLIL